MSDAVVTDSAGPVATVNIAAAVEALAAERGNDLAFRAFPTADSHPRGVTFAELDDLIARFAGGLTARGITRGSRVVVFTPMSVELYVVLLSLFRIGAVAVFIDPWGGRAMIDAAADLVEADAFIGIPKAHMLRATSKSIRRIGVQIVAGDGGPRRAALALPRTESYEDVLASGAAAPVAHAVSVSTDDPALITFTGGTTGTPKGADRTHGFLAAQHEVLTHNVELGPDEVCLTNLPIVVLHALGRGATTVLPPPGLAQDPKIDGAWLHNLIESQRIDVMALSPAPVDGLARARVRRPLTRVKRVYTGGGPVLPELIERVRPVLPNADLIAIYGSTESEPIAHAHGADVMARRDALREHGGIWVGREVDDVDVILARPTHDVITVTEGGSIEDWAVADGTAGEVLVAGPHVNQAYFRNEAAFAENKVRDEHGRVWHRTGDMARRDADGTLWLLGRLAGEIRLGGRTLYPLEVETPMTDAPEIAVAALCQPKFEGAGREFKNAAAVMAVEPAEGFTRPEARNAAIVALTRLGLAAFVEVRTLPQIPVDKRHGTKIDTDALRKKLKPKETGDY